MKRDSGAPAMTLLALETSCDETSAAVLRHGEVRANVVSSQARLHAEYGGVVPELAAREHLRNLIPIAQAALHAAGTTPAQLDAVAATRGPGLPSALMVGLKAAQAVAFALRRPFLGIHHHEAHLYSPWITGAPLRADFGAFRPNVSLIVSGGHTMLVHVQAEGKHRLLGTTVDDAAGECFDKTGKLSYTILGPGGTAYTITGFPTNGIPAPADYLGIGSDQPAVLNPTTGELVIYNPGTGNAPSALRGQLVNFATLPAGSIAVTAPLPYRLPGAGLALGTGGTGGSGGLTTGGGSGTGSTGGTTGGSSGGQATGGTTGGSGGTSTGTGTGSGGSGGSLTTPPGGGGSSSGLGTTGTPGGGSSAPGGSSAGTPSPSGGTGTGTGGSPLGIGVVGKHHRHHLVKKKAHPTRHVVKKGHHHIAAKPAHGHHHVIQVIPADHHAAPAFVIGGHLAHKQNAVDLAIEAVHVNLHHNRKPGHSA